MERLILESVGQFVGHHFFLLVDGNPIGDIEFLGFGVVQAGYLVGENVEQKRIQRKILRNQAKRFERFVIGVALRGVFVVSSSRTRYSRISCLDRRLFLSGSLMGKSSRRLISASTSSAARMNSGLVCATIWEWAGWARRASGPLLRPSRCNQDT